MSHFVSGIFSLVLGILFMCVMKEVLNETPKRKKIGTFICGILGSLFLIISSAYEFDLALSKPCYKVISIVKIEEHSRRYGNDYTIVDNKNNKYSIENYSLKKSLRSGKPISKNGTIKYVETFWGKAILDYN